MRKIITCSSILALSLCSISLLAQETQQAELVDLKALEADFLILKKKAQSHPGKFDINSNDEKKKLNGYVRRMDSDYQGADKININRPIGIKASSDKININLSDLANKYKTPETQPLNKGLNRDYDVLMMVSLSMPNETLIKIAREASVLNIPLVLRGLKNDSIQETQRHIAQIQRLAQKASWSINPPAFTKYKVTAVPTLILARNNEASKLSEEGCAPPGSYVAITGDVSLGYALEEIEKNYPKFSPAATNLFERLTENEKN